MIDSKCAPTHRSVAVCATPRRSITHTLARERREARTSNIEIRRVESADQLDAVCSFRYKVYVREMGRKQQYADHRAERIREPLDDSAMLYSAMIGDRIVGTVRTNYDGLSDFGLYDSLYGIREHRECEQGRVSITTKLMVERAYRTSRVGALLAQATYTDAIRNGISYDFIDCNDPLVPYFEHLGYVWLSMIEHPEYGSVNLMRITVTDTDHFRDVQSPFLQTAEREIARRTEEVSGR